MDLKQTLQNLDFDHNKPFTNIKGDELIQQMLKNIGSADFELRDHLIYSTFARLIMQEYLTHNQMESILTTCLGDDYLFFHIGETSTDTVFKRSFSSLVLALILEKDREQLFLSKQLTSKTIESTLSYLHKEKDTRGFVKGKGWAHSIAHGADLLTVAINHPSFEQGKADACLESIKVCLFKDGQYIDNEDERLIFAVEALLDKGISENVLEKWLCDLSDELDAKFNQDGFLLAFFRQKDNIIGFYKSLYFRLKRRDISNIVLTRIEDLLTRWHNMLYN